jgi:hypothetical protein
VLIAIWFLVAITRVLWIARSPWDWDEMLFTLAVGDYDVAKHQPHPPGFPVFIAAAKLLTSIGLSDFRALQAVTLIASVFLFPAMFLLCRELRLAFPTAVAASMVLAFLPNVWFFGETAFSDVPSLVLSLAACAMLLRGCRSSRAYLGGAVLLALAAGVRPQNLIIGAVPALIATWYQARARHFALIASSAALGMLIVAIAYGVAIQSTGWQRYREVVAEHEHYIRTVDSFLSTTRPSLLGVADDFLFRPFRAGALNTVIAILSAVSAIVSLARARWPILIAIATFGPFAIVAWLTLDWLSASRFAIAYAPLSAILSADGIAILSSVIPSPRVRLIAESLGTSALIIAIAVWTLPAVRLAARELSPPVQAIHWIRDNLDPKRTTIYVGALGPHAATLLRDYRIETFAGRTQIAPRPGSWFLKEGTAMVAGARTFRWPRGPLWNIARRRYFEVSVVPLR